MAWPVSILLECFLVQQDSRQKLHENGRNWTKGVALVPPHGSANDLENEHREELRHADYVEMTQGSKAFWIRTVSFRIDNATHRPIDPSHGSTTNPV